MKPLSRKGLDFVMGKHFAALSTIHRDGSPHTTPIWYTYDDGKFIVNTSLDRVKVKNVRKEERLRETTTGSRSVSPWKWFPRNSWSSWARRSSSSPPSSTIRGAND